MSESSAVISNFLTQIGRRLTRHRVAQAFLWVAAAGAIGGTVAPLAAALVPSLAAPIAALSLTFAVGAVLSLVLVVFFARRRWRQERHVARFVGSFEATLASDLLSSVEFADEARPEFSGELIAALSKSTATRVAMLDPRSVVPASALKRPLAAAFGAAFVLVGLLVIAPSALGRGWSNLAGSTDEIPFEGAAQTRGPVVGDVEISLAFPPYTKRAPVTLPAAAGDFRAMPGTVATVRTRALYTSVGARIVFGDGKEESANRAPIEMSITKGDDGRDVLATEFTVTGAEVYRFLIEEPGGARRVEGEGHRIELEVDKAPDVELHAPADVLDVSNTKRVELAYVASDDYGITKVELVWVAEGIESRLQLPLATPARPLAEFETQRAQSKMLWDLSTVSLPSSGSVPYHLEVFDNDTVRGPNVGKSKIYTLRIFSPREKHEVHVETQRRLFEKLVTLLGERLVAAAEDINVHRELSKATQELVVELGTLASALADDKLASDELRAFLAELRGRYDKLAGKERGLLSQMSDKVTDRQRSALRALDRDQVASLEDDIIKLADWIDRQDLEGMLHIADEIKTHRERLDKLLEELGRTGDPEIAKEIEREMKALEERLAELSQKGQSMPTDVLDQYVNRDANSIKEEKGCLAVVRELISKGQNEAAAEKMKECGAALDASAKQMEQALASLRGDRFTAEQKEIAELMSSLADLAQDEDELAAEIDEVYDKYAEKAGDLASKGASDADGELAKAARALESRLGKIAEEALTPFAKEELDGIKARAADISKMLKDGDLSEALAMSRQAEAGLDRIVSELTADIEDGEPWNKKTGRALEDAEQAKGAAAKLTDDLREATPAPRQVMDTSSRKKLQSLLEKQKALRQRAGQVGKKAEGAKHLPGPVGAKVGEQLGKAGQKMSDVEGRLRAVDPSAARHQAHEAADFLRELTRETERQTRGAEARGRTSLRDEPIRIPGADEYKAPAELREELLEAMKKEGPPTYREMLKRYYEELVK